MDTVTKQGPPHGIAWEAAGLRWLAASGPVPVVEIVGEGLGTLELERIHPAEPTPAAAETLGAGLAALHAAGAAAFGQGPGGWTGDGYVGPGGDLLPLPLTAARSWGASYGRQVRTVAREAERRRRLPGHDLRLVERLADRLEAGDLDDDAAPAVVHGDLWSGNVLWGKRGAVLIDPAAHTGHPLLDLALLQLFGAPHLETVLGAYAQCARLPDGWRERTGLHQVLHLVVHVACFGGSYLPRLRHAARPWTGRC